MGTLIGFVIGYVLGAKAGPEGYEELRRAWRAIVESEELKGLIAAGTAAVQSVLAQGGGSVVEQVRQMTGGSGKLEDAWRRLSGDEELLRVWSSIADSEELRDLLAAGSKLVGGVLAQVRTSFEGGPEAGRVS